MDFGDGAVGGPTFDLVILPSGSEDCGREPSKVLPTPSRSLSYFRDSFTNSIADQGLDTEDLDFLSNHLADGTSAGYGCAFKEFSTFCSTLNVCPFSCSPSIVVKYLRKKYENGSSYSTVNLHRCAISKLHTGFGGSSIGEHPLVSQAVKAVFRLRPPLPKYRTVFDISTVLDYVASLEPLQTLPLKQLTLKTLFLISFSTISRVSSCARMGPAVERGKVSTYSN